MSQPTIMADAISSGHKAVGGETGICSSCSMAFFPVKYNNGICAKCGCPTCDSCLSKAPDTDSIPASILSIPSPLCPNCLTSFDPYIKRYRQAIERAGSIVVFPQTSKGKTGIDSTRPIINIHSDGCATYQDAELQLKIACAFLEYDMVVERSYSKQQVRGSFVRSEWIAIGKLGYKSA